MLSTQSRLRLEPICKDIAAGTEVSLEDMMWAEKLAKANTSARGMLQKARRMFIILDDVVDLNSSLQNDIIDVFNERKQNNFPVTWYSLDEKHVFRDLCLQLMAKVHSYVDLDSCIGYEFWTQNNTKPSGWHQDKDEEKHYITGELSFPLCSLIYYPLVENLQGGQLYLEDDIITPKTNRLVIISAGMWHCVQEFTGKRISFLINPWNKTLN